MISLENAYKDIDSPPIILDDATLKFDIELVCLITNKISF